MQDRSAVAFGEVRRLGIGLVLGVLGGLPLLVAWPVRDRGDD